MKLMLGNGKLVQCEQFVLYLGGVISEDLSVVTRM